MMLYSFVILSFVFSFQNIHAQVWTWISGDSLENKPGVYGTKGLSAPANIPGGREDAVSWSGAIHQLYLFGGQGYDSSSTNGLLNDLWVYNTVSKEWTWKSGSPLRNMAGSYGVKGLPAAGNHPGARHSAVSWTSDSGILYLFGGQGYDSSGTEGKLNDLWKYDSSSGFWTWISGSAARNQAGRYGPKGVSDSTNMPGSRLSASSWYFDNDNLYLYGGDGLDSSGSSGRLNDLWKFDLSTGNWTWLSGSPIKERAGDFGTQGVAAATNIPGSRSGAAEFELGDGSLLLFAGYGFDSDGYEGYINDFWKYDTLSGLWTWLSGSQYTNPPGIYGSKGVPASANIPGARYDAGGWQSGDGGFYLFGGPGIPQGGVNGYLNDLWRFDTTSGQWTWLTGSTDIFQFGKYGAKGVAAATSTPGARAGSVTWSPGDGHLYLFGGYGYVASSNDGRLNDLWRINITGTPASASVYHGWNLIAIPVYPFDETVSGILSDDASPLTSLWQFAPSTGYAHPTEMKLARGYWGHFAQIATIDAIGGPVDVAEIPLETGWNIVGNPFDVSCDVPTMIRFSDGLTTKNLADANAAGWLAANLWGYDGSAYTTESATLDVWSGYWLRVTATGITMKFSRTAFP